MKKLYLFIFLIVISGVMQIQPVNAHTNKLLNGKKVLAAVTPVITFPTITSKVFGAADFSTGATILPAIGILYTTSNSNVATVVNGNIHIVGAGTATITATQPGDGGVNYNAATPVAQTVTVTKGGTAIITGLTATSLALQAADVTLPGVSNFPIAVAPNNPVTYTSSNPAVGTIVNGRLRLTATGTTTITASQTGGANFTDAAPVAVVYTVTAPAAPAFTTNLAGKVLGTVDFDPAATANPTYFSTITYTSSNPAVATIVNNKIRLIGVGIAGSTIITAIITYPSTTSATGFATATTANATLSVVAPTAPVTPAPLITFTSPGTKALGDVDFVPVVTSTSTLPIPITFSSSNTAVATIVNGNIHYISTGTSVITASQGGGATGGGGIPADVNQTLIVSVPTLAITAITGKTTASPDFTPVVTASLTSTPVTFTVSPASIATIVNGVVHLTGGVGTATLIASQVGATVSPANATATFAVTAAPAPAITFAALAARPFSTAEVAIAATTTGPANPVITYSSSNPAIAYVTSNSVGTVTYTSFGTGYKTGSYQNIPLTGGFGTGATANINITSAGNAVAYIVNSGRGYNVGDVLTFTPASLGIDPGTGLPITGGSGFQLTVATTSTNNIRYVGALAAPNNTTLITASQGGGSNGNATYPADVVQPLTVTPLLLNFPTLGTKTYTAQDFNPGVSASATSSRVIYLSSSNPAVASIIATQAFTITSGGTLYTNGTYTNVPLIGGTGTGMLATIVVASGSVTATGSSITTLGTNYSVGDVLSVAPSSLGGTGSGLVFTVGAYTGVIRYNSTVPAAPNNTSVITASMGGGVNGTTTLAPDVSQVLILTAPAIAFAPTATKQFTSVDQNPGATGALVGLPLTYTSSNPAVVTIVNGLLHFVSAPAAPNNTTIITASQVPLPGVNTGTQTLPASVQQVLTVTPATITFPALGARVVGPDFNAGATSTITNTPIVYTSSNPAVATINSNGISNYTTTLGTLYTKAGTFVNVPLIGGTGTGALGTITVSTFGNTFGVVTNSGTGYTIGDVLTITPASVGSTTGSGLSITVTDIRNMIHFVGAPAGNNTTVITASQGGGVTGTPTLPADVSQTLIANLPVINFPVIGTKQLSSTDFSPGATSTLSTTPITYTSSNTAVATVVTGAITSLSSPLGGNAYTDGTYLASLQGGTGTGAIANITIASGSVTSATITGNSSGYTVGDILTAATSSLGGTGAGFNITVTAVNSMLRLVSSPATNNTATITASQGGGATGTAGLPADVSQVITVTPPTINFAPLGNKAYPSVDFILAATSTVNRPITYTSSNLAVATISTINGQSYVHLVAAPAAPNNTVVITASQGGGATGTPVLPADVSQTLTVNYVPVAFNFPALGTKVLTNVDVSLGVSSPLVGVPITYASSNPAVATIVNGKLHMVSVGNANITVSQGGGAAGTLTVPADATQTVTITAPTLNFPPIGIRAYSNVDFNPGASSSITNIPVTYTSSNTNVATVNTTLQLGNLIGGSGYRDNTPANPAYLNVPLTGGTGTGALATVIVSGGSVVSVTVTSTGTLYTPGDVLSCQALSIGGVGNGFNITVTSFYSLIDINPAYPAAPNNTTTIKASLGGGATGTASLPADVSQVLTVVSPTITFPVLGTVPYTPLDFSGNATSNVTNVPITYTSSNPAVATINSAGQIHFVSQTVAGSTIIRASQQNSAANPAPLATVKSTLPADVEQTLTVTAATYNFPALTSKALTSVDLDPAATSTAAGLITYTSSAPAVASIVNNKIHYLTTGTTTITAIQNGITIGSSALTVTAPVISFGTLGTKPYTTTDLAPGATSTITAQAITYTSTNTSVATIVNGNIRFVGAGTTVIEATQQGSPAGTVKAATTTLPADQTQSLIVTAPAITFGPLASRPFQVADLPLTATSSLTSLPITYTSSDPNVATILNGNIHFVGLGSTTIIASQTNAAVAAGLPVPTDVSQTLTVTAPTLAFAALGSPKVFSSTDLAISVTAGYTSTLGILSPITISSSDPNVVSIVYTNGIPNIRYVGIGTTTITASQPGFGNIPAPASISQAFTVTPAVITFGSPGNKTLASADAALAPTSTLAVASFPISLTSSDPTVATIVNSALHVVGLGTVTITASQPTNGNYAPLPVSQTIAVTAATTSTPVLSFTAPFGTRQYTNNGDITPTVSGAVTTAPVTYTSSNPLVATIVNGNIHLSPPAIINGVAVYPNPNTTVITASQGGGATGIANSLPADVSQVLTVTPPSINFPPLGVQRYTTVDLNPGAISSYTFLAPDNTALPINYTSSDPNVAIIVNSQIRFVGLGTTVITASLGNVIVPNVSQTLVVIPAAITFAPSASRTLSSIDVPPGATSTYASVPITYTSSDPSIVSIVNGNLHFNNVGVVTITASQAITGPTAPFSATQVLTVTAPALTFAATRAIAYTTTDQDPGATSPILNAPITYTSSNPALVNIVNNKLHFNIVNQTGGYNNTAIITATQAPGGNYPAITAAQTLTVTQAIIIQNPLNKYYGDPDFSPGFSTLGYPVSYSSATTTVATVVGGGTLVHIVSTGSSILTASQAGDVNTLAATNQVCTLVVVAAPIIIAPKNITRLYGVENPVQYPLNYTGFKSASGSAPLDDSTKFTVQPTLISVTSAANPTVNLLPALGGFIPKTLPVGIYTLTYGGAVSTFYNIIYGTGTLTVTPAPQTLTMDQTPITKKFKDPDFDPLARTNGDPIVYTSSNPAVASIQNGKVHLEGVGVTTITATLNATSGNFSGTSSLSVQLTVLPGDQTITASNIPELVKGSANYTVIASASSGLPVQLVITDPLIATVVGQTIKPLRIGTTIVTVKQAGNASYSAAPDVVLYLKVVDPSGDQVKVNLALSPNADGINDFLVIEGVQDFPGNHVSIINRNGIKVFNTVGYDNKNNVFVGKSNSGEQLPAGTYFYLVDYSVGDQKNHITGYFVLKY